MLNQRNGLFVLRQLERSIEKQKDVYACLFYYSKAFDTGKHEPLIRLLQYFDTDTQDIKLISNLYINQKAAIRHRGERS